MGLLGFLISKENKKNLLLEVNENDCKGLICVKCGTTNSPYLYLIENLLCCIECGEAQMRRGRFERENHLFD